MDREVLEQGVFFALQAPKFVADPYALYRRLRLEAPFHWDFVLGGWFLTRYADISAALTDRRFTTENFFFDVSQLPPDLQRDLAPLGRIRKREVLYNDAPEHERLRRPLNRAFHPATFERLRPEMEKLAQDLLVQAEERQTLEVVSEYSRPLADHLMATLLGLPDAERPEVIGWCDRIREFVSSRRMGHPTVVKAREAVKSLAATRAYTRRLIVARRTNFADDVISHSLAVEVGEEPLTEDEVLANCVFFLHAGIRNLSASITNAVLTLLQHPQEFAHLRENPGCLALAVEELLRYETPVQVAIRGVRESMDFAGQHLRPRQLLVLLLGAANRDPAQFPEPDRLDFGRQPNRHLSFGVGPHGCIGAWIARFGLTIAIEAMLQRPAKWRRASRKLHWNFPAMRRTVHELPVLVNRPFRGRRKSAPQDAQVAAPKRNKMVPPRHQHSR